MLDTHTFVSATIRTLTPPAEVLLAWRRKLFDLISSPPLLAEFQATFDHSSVRRYVRWTQEDIENLLKEVEAWSIWVEPKDQLAVITRDPDDNRVLEAAVTGHADAIVSGDRDLLDLGEYDGIKILTPRQFLDLLERTR